MDEMKQREQEEVKNNTCMSCNEIFQEEQIVRPADKVVLCKTCWQIPHIVKDIKERYKI